jgi:hypothetical protein
MRRTALVTLALLAACASPPPPSMAVAAAPAAPPPPDPCARAAAQRARVPPLVEAGRLDRAVRVIAAADALCARDEAGSWAARLDALLALDRLDDARALATMVERDARADGAAREAAARAREAKPSGERAEGTVTAALAARRRGAAAEAQRLFDRAAAQIAREQGAPLTLEVRNGLEASAGLPWASNGGIFPHSLGVIDPSPVYSRDGGRVALADGDHVLVVDARARRLSLRLAGHGANVSAMAWSDDGKLLASGAYDDAVRVWDAQTGRCLLTLPVGSAARALRFLRDGAALGCAHDDATAWELPSGKLLARTAGPAASAASIDPDGVVTATEANTPTKRFDIFTGQLLPGGAPRATALTPDGKLGADGYPDRVELLRYPGGKRVRALRARGVSRVWIAPDGARVAGGEEATPDGPVARVRFWDAKSGQELGVVPIEEAWGYSVEVLGFGEGGKARLRGGGEEREVELRTGKVLRRGPAAPAQPRLDVPGLGGADAWTPMALALSDDLRTAAIVAELPGGEEWPSRVVLVDTVARTLRELATDVAPLNELRFHQGGLLGWSWGSVVAWDLATGARRKVLDAEAKGWGLVGLSQDAGLAFADAKRRGGVIVDLATGAPRAGGVAQPIAGHLLAFSPDGALALLEPAGGGVDVLDTRTGKTTSAPGLPATKGWTATVSGDGRWALAIAKGPPALTAYVVSTTGGRTRQLDGAYETLGDVARAGEHGLILTALEQGAARSAEARLLDLEQAAFTRTFPSHLWEGGGGGVTKDERLYGSISRPEAVIGVWGLDDGAPRAAIRVLVDAKIVYALTPEGLLEVFGDAAALLDQHAYCQAGARVYPSEVCAERFLTTGLVRGLLTGDASYRAP